MALVEDTGLRTLNAKVFVDDVDPNIRRLSAKTGAIHYEPDGGGALEEIDSNIIPSPHPNFDWQSTANKFTVGFKNDLTSANPIVFQRGNDWVSFRPRGIALYDRVLDEYTVFANPSASTPNIVGSRITYPDIYGQNSAGFWITGDGAKEFFRVNSLNGIPDPSTYGYDPATTFLVLINEINHNFDQPGDSVEDESGGIAPGRDLGKIAFKKAGAFRFQIPDLYAFDTPPVSHVVVNKLIKRLKMVGQTPYLLHGIEYTKAMQASVPLIIDASVSVEISATTDDGYESRNAGTWIDTTTLLVGADIGKSGDEYDGGFRFQNVTVPQGATINSASLTLRLIGGLNVANIDTNLTAAEEDDAAAWGTGTHPSDRDHTEASVTWDGWVGAGSDEVSPDCATVIAEVTDRAGWSSGNAIALMVTNDQAITTANADVYNRNDGTANLPTLDIDYTAGAGATIPPLYHHYDKNLR